MYSDRRVIHLIQEICVIEANIEVRFLTGSSYVSVFLRMRSENRPITRLLCCQIAEILAPLWAIAVAEHDGILTR